MQARFIDTQLLFFCGVVKLYRDQKVPLTDYLEVAPAYGGLLVYSDDSSVIIIILPILPLIGNESLIVE